MTLLDHPDTEQEPTAPAPDQRLRRVLLVVIAVAALVIALGGGWFLRGADDDGAAASGPTAVDIGFAQDMITHHTQAVTMAGIERDGTASTSLHSLAFDMETSQQLQVGQMFGWLDAWGKSYTSDDPMAWMGHDHMSLGAGGLMPGMATPAQMDKLVTLSGKALDIMFLQLMIHHHQGGLPMAKYAVEHATEPYVRNLAQSMINSQSTEILQMEQQLRELGARPLPPPT